MGERFLLKGNDASSLGALAAGLKFMSAYPMTPATGVTGLLSLWAAVLCCYGTSGRRNLCHCSGDRCRFHRSKGHDCYFRWWIALMTEALSLAGSVEVPVGSLMLVLDQAPVFLLVLNREI